MKELIFPFFFSDSALKATEIRHNKLKIGILEHLYRNGPMTLYDLSHLVDTSIPTVSKLVLELINKDVIKDLGIGESSGGRKPNLFGLKPNSYYILSIKISKNSLEMALTNIANEIRGKIYTEEIETTNNPDLFESVIEKTQKFIRESCLEIDKLLGVGIALSGLIDKQKITSPINYAIGKKAVDQYFKEKLNLPVFVENDATVMALAESYKGNAKGVDHALIINWDKWIGLGVIINGKLFDGHTGYAGEFGHIQIKKEGELCYCGKRGCLETLAGGNSFTKRVQNTLSEGKSSMIDFQLKGDYTKLNEKIILHAALRGDQYALEMVEEITDTMGFGISSLIHLFNPELIVIAGSFSEGKHLIINSLHQSLKKYTISEIYNVTEIKLSAVEGNAALIGASCLVMDKIFRLDPNN